MQNLPPDLLPRLTQLLMPHLSEEERDAWLTQAFYLTEPRLYHQIDMGGNAIVFTTKCLKTLFKFECLPSGIHSVSALLGAMRFAGVGVDKQQEIDNLIAIVDSLCQPDKPEPEAPAPLPPVDDAPQTLETPRAKRKPTLFISYSSGDRDFAVKLVDDLQKAGHACWIDNSKIKGGDEWIRSIGEGLTNSYAMLTIVSEKANKSRWVEREFIWADNNKRPIFPIWAEACDLPWYMGNLQGTILYENYDANLRDLLASLPKPVIDQPDDKPIVVAERTITLRELELEYLNRVLLEHNIWQAVYTPMAGVATIRQHPDKKTIKRATAGITPIYSLREKLHDEMMPEQPTIQQNFSDITEAVNSVKQLVVLGDPGAGKTTTLWKLAADYAQLAVDDPKRPLPVFLRLGGLDYATTVHDAIQTQLGDISLDKLLEDKRVALLIDGLNELPDDGGQETKIAELREIVQKAQSDDRIAVVTCRELDYIADVDLNIQEQVNITPLDPTRIREFCHHHLPEDGETLFWALLGQDAEAVQRFWEAWQQKNMGDFLSMWQSDDESIVRRSDRRVIRSLRKAMREDSASRSMLALARNPYMLFMMTEVFAENEGKLPPNQGKLFDLFTDYLLQNREGLSKADSDALQNKLAEYAYTMQVQGLGTITGKDIALQYLNDKQLYQAVSANLLEDRGDVRFTHQLLQEYFAARRLDVERKNGLSASDLWSADNWWVPNDWNETAILLTGLYNDDATEIINWLASANPELTARCINESGANIPDATLLTLREKWLPRAFGVGTSNGMSADDNFVARAAIGRALGQLKLSNGEILDNRDGVGVKDGLPDIDWVTIPAGEFIYQEGEKRTLPEFRMSRYPITYAQFQTFVDTLDSLNSRNWFEGLGGRPDRYTMAEQYFKYWNHPRGTVNWYQSMAFCRWFSYKLGGGFGLDDVTSWVVRLPTEYEWEKAARGTDGSTYPYGNEFDATKGNTYEIGIGQTSAVGIFRDGASPYGVLDMAGNVWEWCLSDYENPAEHPNGEDLSTSNYRVLRGGSFNYRYSDAGASYRDLNNPDYWRSIYGFRVVVSPILNAIDR